jgi:hypothetical protein
MGAPLVETLGAVAESRWRVPAEVIETLQLGIVHVMFLSPRA